jgi:hypothetical protein
MRRHALPNGRATAPIQRRVKDSAGNTGCPSSKLLGYYQPYAARGDPIASCRVTGS